MLTTPVIAIWEKVTAGVASASLRDSLGNEHQPEGVPVCLSVLLDHVTSEF